jgi:AraC-like DNA-binding protein
VTAVRIPPLGLTKHPPRDVFLLKAHFPDHPEALQGYAVCAVEDWRVLRERIRSALPSSVALVRTRGTEEEVARLEELVRGTASVPVVGAIPFAEVDAARVRAVLAAGVAEIANTSGIFSLEALVPTLRRAHAQPLKRRIEERLPVWMPEEARTLLRAAGEAVVDRGGRDLFAGIFGVYFRTLSAHCAAVHLPPPRRLLGWLRVLLALALLEEADRTVMNAAVCCGYNDNSSLKRAIENFTGTPASASTRHQSFDAGFDRFADELRALRHGIHPARAALA